MIAPPVYVAPGAAAPRSPFGLLDAAAEVIPEDPHFVNGIEFQPQCAQTASVDARDCTDHDAFDLPDGSDGLPTTSVAPVNMFAGFVCRLPGMTGAQITATATAAITNSAPAALERLLWTPPDDPGPVAPAPAQLRLMGPDTVTLAAGDAVGVTAGIRLLEDYLATHYGRVGVIHTPAGVSADLSHEQLVRWDTGKPVTPRGTRYSWGAYPYTDPTGADADAGTAWLVATGAITLRQTPVRVYDDIAQILNRTTNEFLALASRTYVVAWECVTAAVLVTLDS